MKIKICPKCKSKNVDNKIDPQGAPAFYKCKDCGFESYLIPEKAIKTKKKK